MIMRALIVRKEHLDKILDGSKTWEMRSSKTNIRGRIGLIESGSGLIVGEVDLLGWARLDIDILDACKELHQVEDISLLKKWKYSWVLKNAKHYAKPIPYEHPQGAVIWVRLI